MDLYEAMRTTPATRAFTRASVSDELLHRVLEHARFAPSGGNRQPWRVIVVRSEEMRREIGDLAQGTFREYVAQMIEGAEPFACGPDGRWRPPEIDLEAARARDDLPRFDAFEQAAAVLVVCARLTSIAVMDAELERQSIVGGASVYPLVQNILLGLRNEGIGGVPITFLCRDEPALKPLLGVPDGWAIACAIALGEPQRRVTRLRRVPVEELVRMESFDGPGLLGLPPT